MSCTGPCTPHRRSPCPALPCCPLPLLNWLRSAAAGCGHDRLLCSGRPGRLHVHPHAGGCCLPCCARCDVPIMLYCAVPDLLPAMLRKLWGSLGGAGLTLCSPACFPHTPAALLPCCPSHTLPVVTELLTLMQPCLPASPAPCLLLPTAGPRPLVLLPLHHRRDWPGAAEPAGHAVPLLRGGTGGQGQRQAEGAERVWVGWQALFGLEAAGGRAPALLALAGRRAGWSQAHPSGSQLARPASSQPGCQPACMLTRVGCHPLRPITPLNQRCRTTRTRAACTPIWALASWPSLSSTPAWACSSASPSETPG